MFTPDDEHFETRFGNTDDEASESEDDNAYENDNISSSSEARVGGSKNKREDSPVKSMADPVVGSPLGGASFFILSVYQDMKPPSTIPTNFIFLIFVVVLPKKKSQKTAPPSKNAFDSDYEDDDFDDEDDMEGMTMSTLPLSVFSFFLNKGDIGFKDYARYTFPLLSCTRPPSFMGVPRLTHFYFSSICRSEKIVPETSPSLQTTIIC